MIDRRMHQLLKYVIIHARIPMPVPLTHSSHKLLDLKQQLFLYSHDHL
jgi:hypothetical protein